VSLVRSVTVRGEALTLRPLEGLQEFRECVELQELTWGVGFSQRVPLALLRVTQRLGGVTAGAFDAEGTQVAFVYGVTGLEGDGLLHWSDMLAVLPEWRGSGLGFLLKLYQKDFLLELGVRRMRWTFDPLESRNAHLNIHRLGVICREYAVDMYGESNSPLHQGVGTDRFVPLWEMDSDRVSRRTSGEAPGSPPDLPDAFSLDRSGDLVAPAAAHPALADVGWTPDLSAGEGVPDLSGVFVPIPADFQALKSGDLELAVRWRRATRAVLAPALAAGWEVREFFRGEDISRYLLVPPTYSESNGDT